MRYYKIKLISSIVFFVINFSLNMDILGQYDNNDIIRLDFNKLTKIARQKDANLNSRLIKTIYYGEEKDRLGIIGTQGWLCPQSFFVDQDGTISILDVVNSRIVSVKGNDFSTINIKLPKRYFRGDLFKDKEGSFLITDGKEILKITKKDKLITQKMLADRSELGKITIERGKFVYANGYVRLEWRSIEGFTEIFLQKKVNNTWKDWILIYEPGMKLDLLDELYESELLTLDLNNNLYLNIRIVPAYVRPYEEWKHVRYILKTRFIGKHNLFV